MIAEFAARRTATEMESAAARWEQGDAKGCEQTLRQLIARDPGHLPAQFMLADLLVATDREADAVALLQQVVQLYPEDAQAHFQLGLVLDVIGDDRLARTHFQTAVELDPENELFQATLQ